MGSRLPSQLITALCVAAGLSATATQAQAHAHLVSATPAENATVPAPKAITLHFSEKLEPKFSGLEVVKADGSKAPVSAEVLAKDRKTIVGTVSGQLAPGVYRVRWHTVSVDSHRMEEVYSFTVR